MRASEVKWKTCDISSRFSYHELLHGRVRGQNRAINILQNIDNIENIKNRCMLKLKYMLSTWEMIFIPVFFVFQGIFSQVYDLATEDFDNSETYTREG